MEMAFASPFGSVSRYWGPSAGRGTTPQHRFGKRALTAEELRIVGGGDDGGDCGAGGDCGDCGAGGDCGADPSGSDTDAPSETDDGVVTITLDTVTIVGHATPITAADAPPLTASQSAQFGALLGGAVGLFSFVGGITGAATLGEAIAIGTVLGGIVGLVSLGVVIAGIALAALVAEAIANQNQGTPDYGGGGGESGGGDGG